MQKIIIAIDGYSSSGKSTMARALAREIGYTYIDSGAMYRAITLYAMRHGLISPEGRVDEARLVSLLPQVSVTFSPVEADGVQHTLLNGEDVEREIRDMAVSSHVSPVAVIGAVRDRVDGMLRELGSHRGIVMDGRDIGTTVFPDAEMKVFVDASPEERARRRFRELTGKGEKVTYEEVLENVRTRDRIDTTREVSPLRKAPDAHVLDNSGMTPAGQMKWLIELYHKIVSEK